MVVAEALPMAVWFVDNQTVLKKLDRLESETGSDWRVKPRPEIFHHPWFTIDGFGYFISILSGNFWRARG